MYNRSVAGEAVVNEKLIGYDKHVDQKSYLDIT